MVLKIYAFDASSLLDNPQAQIELLSDALASGDGSYVAGAIGLIARARGMTQIARDAGLSRQALYDALSDEGNPTLDTVMRVLRAMQIDLKAGARAA